METPVCKVCGKFPKYDRPKQHKKVIMGKSFYLNVCQECLLKKFPHIKNLSRIFNTCNEVTQYAFDIPKELAKQSNAKYAWTKEKAIKKYGDEGILKWEEYRRKQSYKNTFEAKRERYGWTEDDFKKFNQSRAVTKENLIKKHGEKYGVMLWDQYRLRQSETKSWEWMVKQYGEERAKEINSQKSLTLENFVRKYGEEGESRWEAYCIKKSNPYSHISQVLFQSLDEHLGKKYTTYFATKGDGEWFIRGDNQVYYLDYFIKELNICIEFNGNSWHGNPKMYKKDEHCHPIYKDITAGELQKKDKDRIKDLQKQGIKTYTIWEADYNPKDFDPIQYIITTLEIEL